MDESADEVAVPGLSTENAMRVAGLLVCSLVVILSEFFWAVRRAFGLFEQEQAWIHTAFANFLAKLGICVLTLLLWREYGGKLRESIRSMRSTLAVHRQPVRRCTAEVGLVDSLPAELLPHLLAAGRLAAVDLAHCAAVCRSLAAAVADPNHDTLLWRPACQERWASKVYDPLLVYPEELAGLSHRERYAWAERDGARQLGTGSDVCKVAAWSVEFGGGRRYTIAPFPYRNDGQYVSSTFGGGQGDPQRWSVKASRYPYGFGNVVLVDGIPDVRISRRADWGWELRNLHEAPTRASRAINNSCQSDAAGVPRPVLCTHSARTPQRPPCGEKAQSFWVGCTFLELAVADTCRRCARTGTTYGLPGRLRTTLSRSTVHLLTLSLCQGVRAITQMELADSSCGR